MYNNDEHEIIKFDADFNEDFDNILMDIISECKRLYFLDSKGFGIKEKRVNSIFNKSVDLLPSNLTHIKFGYSFNKCVDNLPFLLEWLEFGYLFNQRVDMLPNTIIYLVFGYSFNQEVNNLPNSLEYVSFGPLFNKPIDNLPNSIFYINIGSVETNNYIEFTQQTFNLPLKLENIVIWWKNKKYPIKNDFIKKLNDIILNKN